MKKIVKKIIDKQTLIFIIGGLIINALCFFIYAFPVKASGNENDAYFPMHQNENGHFTQDCINQINNRLDTENKFLFIKFSDFRDLGYAQMTWFWVYSVTKEESGDISVFGEIYNNHYQFSLYENSEYAPTVTRYCWDTYGQTFSVVTTGNVSEFMGLNSSTYDSNCDYLSNFSLYTNNTTSRGVVLSYGDDSDFLPTTAQATRPDFRELLSQFHNGHSKPTEVPQNPTFNTYTWNTYNPPAFDNSSVLNALESLGNKIEYNYNYLKDGLHGEIYTLNGNIKAYFEYIGATFQYYGDLIIANIQNGIQNLYDNFVSLFQPLVEDIQTFINFIINPLDTSVLNTQLNNSSFIGAVRTTKNQISTFNGMFSNISQPENVIFTIDLSGLWFNGGVSYLDFSILTPVLPFIRLVLGCILLYDLIVTLFTNINSYIGGNSAKNDGG